MNNTDTLRRAEIFPRPVENTGTDDEQRPSTGDVARATNSSPARAEVTPLFPAQVADEFGERWTQVQAGFVDDPRAAVQHADELVALAIRKLADSFSQERSRLETEWARGGDVSTEDLRIALQRYRSFFHRLLHL